MQRQARPERLVAAPEPRAPVGAILAAGDRLAAAFQLALSADQSAVARRSVSCSMWPFSFAKPEVGATVASSR